MHVVLPAERRCTRAAQAEVRPADGILGYGSPLTKSPGRAVFAGYDFYEATPVNSILPIKNVNVHGLRDVLNQPMFSQDLRLVANCTGGC
jgi:hypothetical protein